MVPYWRFSKEQVKWISTMFPLLVLAWALAFSVGCGKPPSPTVKASSPSLVWPLPPEKPRIRYLHFISAPEDIGISTSIYEKFIGVLAGKKPHRTMVRPYGTHVSESGMLCVTDPGMGAVHQFDLKNSKYRQIKKFGQKSLVSPIGVAMNESGDLYVSDSILRKVFVFGPRGEPVREIGGEDRFFRPTGVAIHFLLKRLYVTDTQGQSIQVFDLDGKFLFHFGRRGNNRGEFNFPTSLAIDRDGNLYVNDSLNYRIQVFSPDGKFLSMFGKHGDGMGEFSNPKGVALDTEGHVYVADAIFDSVQIFSPKGELLLCFGEAGRGPGEFWMPSSISIDKTNRIFVADSYNQRVQVFQFLGGQ